MVLSLLISLTTSEKGVALRKSLKHPKNDLQSTYCLSTSTRVGSDRQTLAVGSGYNVSHHNTKQYFSSIHEIPLNEMSGCDETDFFNLGRRKGAGR